MQRLNTYLLGHQYSRRYLTEPAFRIKISLSVTLALNLIYAVFKLAAGVSYASFWYGADALCYVLLSAMRFFLLYHMRQGKPDLAEEFRQYRFCAYLLFGLNLALIGVVYQIVNQGMGYRYPGLLIYTVATYTFFCTILAVIHVIRYRRLNSPVLSAAKAINLAKALVAMFALQTAMFASFGDENKAVEGMMNSILGGIVCFFIFAMAVYMVIRANRSLKKIALDLGGKENEPSAHQHR